MTQMENVAPCTAYLDEITPDVCITVVDGITHKCAFSFTEFLKLSIRIYIAKVCSIFQWKPSYCFGFGTLHFFHFG